MPKKIARDDNEKARKEKSYKPSKDVTRLRNILLQAGAFGLDVKTLGKLGNRMYVDAPSIEQYPYSTLDEYDSKSRETYGAGRVENITSKLRYEFTEHELDWFHWAFTRIMGKSWGEEIDKFMLVTQPLHDVFCNGLAKTLDWPTGLPVAYGLQSVFRLNSDPNLSLQFIEAPSDGKRGMQSSTRPLAKMRYPNDNRPMHTEKWQFLARVAGIQHKNIFLFETYDSEVEFADKMAGDDLFSLFPQNLVQVEGEKSDIPAFSGSAFEITNLPGSFIAHAMTFPDDWAFQGRFGVDPNPYPDPWTQEQGRVFLGNVQKWLNHQPDALQLASYAYRV